MDEERIEEQDVVEDEARDDARADRYDDSEIKSMLSDVLSRLESISDGMKALFVKAPAAAVEELDDVEEENYSLDDLEL